MAEWLETSETIVWSGEEREIIDIDLKVINDDEVGLLVWVKRSETEDI